MMRGSRRQYQPRSLTDTDHPEAGELWDFNAKNLHPLRNNKESIAAYVMIGSNKVKSSIPNGAFKNRMYPNTMKTFSFNEYSEPDTQPRDQTLTPLEYMGFMNMSHALPKGVTKKVRESSFVGGRADAVVRRGKWKTSHAAKTKNVKFAPYQRTGTSMHTFKGARGNRGKNRGILATGPDDAFVTSEFRPGVKPPQHVFLNKEVATAFINIGLKWSTGDFEAEGSILKSADFATILRAGVDFTDPTIVGQVARALKVPPETIGPGIRAAIAWFIKARKFARKKGKKKATENAPETEPAGPPPPP